MLHVQAFLDALPIMAMGMAGVFLVTASIIAVVSLLHNITGKFEK